MDERAMFGGQLGQRQSREPDTPGPELRVHRRASELASGLGCDHDAEAARRQARQDPLQNRCR